MTTTAPAPLTTRRAQLSVGSFNPETRRFVAVAATSHPVVRRDPYTGERTFETLVVTEKAVDLSRFATGRAALLDAHQAWSARDQIGRIVSARIEKGELIVEAEVSGRDDLQPLRDDLAAGIVRNVSVGYAIAAREIIPAAKPGEPATVRVTRWQPAEISLVPIGADPSCHVRSATMDQHNVEIVDADDQLAESAAPAPAAPALHRGSAAAERRRASEIVTIGREARIDSDEIETALSTGTTLDAFRRRAFEIMAARDKATPSGHVHNGEAGDDGLGRAVEGALLARMTGAAPQGRARDFASMSLTEVGRVLLAARGERVSGMSRDRIAERMLSTREGGLHTTSDFPFLLTNTGNRVLLDAYAAAGSPLKLLARKRTAPDFRALSMLRLSEMPRLLKVNESGEVTRGTMGETKQGFALATYARIFGLTRQAIVNDDLSGFSDAARGWGQAAAQLECEKLTELLTANSGDGLLLSDSVAIYSTAATRKNKAAAGGVISVATLAAARQSMREVKGIDGVTPINVVPKYILVSPAKETEAEQIVAQLAPAQTSNVNPFSNKLEVLVEPRLTGNAWRVFSDPASAAVLTYAYLSGAEGPQLFTREGFDVEGMETKVRLDFGAGVEDWRGSYLNAGA